MNQFKIVSIRTFDSLIFADVQITFIDFNFTTTIFSFCDVDVEAAAVKFDDVCLLDE